jgi:hypothetical protein
MTLEKSQQATDLIREMNFWKGMVAEYERDKFYVDVEVVGTEKIKMIRELIVGDFIKKLAETEERFAAL